MFYFFHKGTDYLRCELLPTDDGWFDLRIQEPGCEEQLERFGSLTQAQERWEQLRVRFNIDGWAGPFGRD